MLSARIPRNGYCTHVLWNQANTKRYTAANMLEACDVAFLAPCMIHLFVCRSDLV